MESTYSDREALDAFEDLKSLLMEKHSIVVEFTNLSFYEDDGCWSIDMKISKGPVMWSNELENKITAYDDRFHLMGECSYEDRNKPGNSYSVHLMEKD